MICLDVGDVDVVGVGNVDVISFLVFRVGVNISGVDDDGMVLFLSVGGNDGWVDDDGVAFISVG